LSRKKFQKSVDSIQRQIEIHYGKIDNEENKPVPDMNLIKYWQKEISGLKKSWLFWVCGDKSTLYLGVTRLSAIPKDANRIPLYSFSRKPRRAEEFS